MFGKEHPSTLTIQSNYIFLMVNMNNPRTLFRLLKRLLTAIKPPVLPEHYETTLVYIRLSSKLEATSSYGCVIQCPGWFSAIQLFETYLFLHNDRDIILLVWIPLPHRIPSRASSHATGSLVKKRNRHVPEVSSPAYSSYHRQCIRVCPQMSGVLPVSQ